MNVLTVWILVTISHYGVIVYSPPVERLVDCQTLQSAAIRNQLASQCVKVRLVK